MQKGKKKAYFEKLGTCIDLGSEDLSTILLAHKQNEVKGTNRIERACTVSWPQFWPQIKNIFTGQRQLSCQRRRGYYPSESSCDSEKFKEDLALFSYGISPLCSALKGDLGALEEKLLIQSLKKMFIEIRSKSCAHSQKFLKARLEESLKWARLQNEFLLLEEQTKSKFPCRDCEVNIVLMAIYKNAPLNYPT